MSLESQREEYPKFGPFLMGWASGTVTSVILSLAMQKEESMTGYTLQELEADLVAMEASLPHGGKALLEFCTETLPTGDDLLIFDAELIAAGFKASRPAAKIIVGVPTTTLVLQKGSPVWAALIAVLPVAIIGGLITFGITRLEAITKALLPIILAGGGILVLIAGLLARPAERVAAAYLPRGR